MSSNILVTKDEKSKKLTIIRGFNAPAALVWQAWTQSKMLDKWWAPRPWKTETKRMDLREGGHWLYAMTGSDGARHWARMDYQHIDEGKSIAGIGSFCDGEGNINPAMPVMRWLIVFEKAGKGTKVVVTISFEREADMQTILEMGFQTGFTMALGNLEELLSV